MGDLDGIDRRMFAQRLVAGTGSLALAVAPTALVSAEESPSAPKPPENPPAEGQAKPELPPTDALLLTYLVRRFPSEHLDEEALKGIFRDIRGDLARGELLSDFPLKNSDEPAFEFRAFRKSE